MKIKSHILKQTTFLVIALLSFSTLLLPLTSLRAATLADGMNAEYVIGSGSGSQDFTATTSGTSATTFNFPVTAEVDEVNNRLFVSDNFNNRVLVFNLDATTKLPLDYTADYVLGQADFTSGSANRGGAVAANTLEYPSSLSFDDQNNVLYVADYGNNRVVGYDVSTIISGEAATYVLGQANFTSDSTNRGNPGAIAGGMSAPDGLAIDVENSLLYVGERMGHRVIVFDISSISSGDNGDADYVLGQANFTSNSENRGGAAANNTLSRVPFVEYDSTNSLLYVADGQAGGASNYRIMIFDVSTITNGESAVNVLGQSDFTTTSSGASENGFGAWVTGISLDSINNRLFVSDIQRNRVMVFDVSTITNGESAVNVLGQTNFTDTEGGTSQSKFSFNAGIEYVSNVDLLYSVDLMNARILIFDLSSSSAEEPTSIRYSPPPTCTATTIPNTITKGDSSTLSWDIQWPTDRRSTFYTKIPKNGLYSDRVSSITVSPEHTTTYRIATFNLWGANFCESTITVLNEGGEELISPKNSLLTAGAGNSPFAKAILNFFRSLFVR